MKKSFHFLWISQLFANLGDVFYIVGLISTLYQASESPFYLALLPFLNTAGRMISSSLAPLFINRYPLKSLLAGSQSLKTLLLFVLAFATLKVVSLTFIFIIIFTIAFLDGFAQPASSAFIPRIVEKSKLLRANSFLSMIHESTQLGGWALGGIFVAATNGQFVIWATFILYILASIFIMFVIDTTPFERKVNAGKKQELVEGFKLIWNIPSFRTIHVMIILESIANVVWVAAIMYIFVTEVLHVSESWWGYINAAFFIGLIIGGFVCSKLEKTFEKNIKKIILYSSVAMAISMLAFGLNTIAILALLLSLVFGIFDQFKGILFNTWLQLNTKNEQLLKIYSTQGTISSFLFGLSTLLAGALADNFSVQWLYVGAGLLLLASAIYFNYVQKRFE